MAAIEVLDAEVVASGGEVITSADRRKAIKELDAAVEATQNTFPRLAKAVADVQRLKAWDVDEDYVNARMMGQIEIGDDGDQFVAFARHRYGWASSHAYRIGAGGRIVAAIEASTSPIGEVPTAENQVRPLTKLLKLHDAETVIPQVWEQAVERADGDLSATAGYIRRIIAEHPKLRTRKTEEELDREFEARLRRFRKLFRDLLLEMNPADFQERVLDWQQETINEETG